jgi:hypothetical protein
MTYTNKQIEEYIEVVRNCYNVKIKHIISHKDGIKVYCSYLIKRGGVASVGSYEIIKLSNLRDFKLNQILNG